MELVLSARLESLGKNFRRMFWVQALLNVKALNLVTTIFYVSRGLTLAQVFYLSIIWSVTNLLFEIPSSYLADRWGRKRTIMLAMALYAVSGVLTALAHSFLIFGIQFFIFALSYACLSGTDDALIYDTAKELQNESKSLRQLGSYYSAEQIFKILMAPLAAIIVRNVQEWQFLILIGIDIISGILALAVAARIVEPHHTMDVEQSEAGVLIDAWKLLRGNWTLARAMLNQSLVFIGSFIIWRYHQDLFTHWGISIVLLGFSWGVKNILQYLTNRHVIHWLPKVPVHSKIFLLNSVYLIFTVALFVLVLYHWLAYIALVCFFVLVWAEPSRNALFSEYFNKQSHSYNRATTLSLTNLLKCLFDVPTLFLAAYCIQKGVYYPFIISLGLGLIVIAFFRLKPLPAQTT